MDKLSAMQTFVRVAQAGSFSAVAGETGTTQSAVSKQVAALERALGVKLFSRTTRAISLTPAGACYLEHARRLVAEVETVEAALRRGTAQVRGWIRVAASVGFGRLKLLPLAREFMAAHPQVKVDLRLHDGLVDLVEQGIDLAVRVGPLDDSGLVARRVGVSRLVLVAHSGYIESLDGGRRAPRCPEDLHAHDCIVYTGLASRNLWTFVARAGAQAPPGSVRAVRVDGRLQSNSSEVMRAAIVAGMGVGYAPDWLVEAELASGELERLMPDWEAPEAPVHLVSPPERRHSARVRAFAEFLARRLAQPPP